MSKAIHIPSIVSAYAKYLSAGASYGAALRDASEALKGAPCPELLEALAKVHAKHFACNVSWSAKGTAVFHTGAESTRETRNVAAAVSWSRNVACHFRDAGEVRTQKVVAVNKRKVAAVVDICAGLTKAEVVALLAAVRESISFE
jgi:hypothetical protein